MKFYFIEDDYTSIEINILQNSFIFFFQLGNSLLDLNQCRSQYILLTAVLWMIAYLIAYLKYMVLFPPEAWLQNWAYL